MRKKIIIVGGGFTGIIVALFLSNKHDVSLYEAKNDIGGVLKDINYKDQNFLRGCQYLDAKSKWFKKLYPIVKNELEIFDPTYNSYTQYKNKVLSSKKFECPAFEKIKIKKSYLNKKKISLTDRFRFYNLEINSYLKELLKKFEVDPGNLIFNNAVNFQMDRITSIKQEDELEKLKRNKLYDSLYAIDANRLKIVQKSALPKNGYDRILKLLNNFLKKNKVKIYTGKKIIPFWEKKKLKLFYEKKLIEGDHIIWTANPVALLNRFHQKNLDSKSIIVKQVDFNYQSEKFYNTYIQVFSSKTSIYRIFLYKFNGHQKISLECSGKMKENINKIKEKLIEILISFNIGFNPSNLEFINETKYLRYDLCTLNDFKMISKFKNSTKNSNLITSDWEVYGRDIKINNLLNELQIRKII